MSRRWTIQDCKQFAQDRGGDCLTTEYKNNSTKMTWKCDLEHTWQAHWNNVKDSGTWCPYCRGNLPIGIDECRNYAEAKGGRCLTEEYTNIYDYMDWECELGHTWSVAFAGMRALQQWCPYCSGRHNNNLEKVQSYAESKGGVCLEEEYIDNKTMMRFQCFADPNNEHIWIARWDWMSRDETWCPYCSGKYNNSLESCRSLAESKGGKCLSTIYKNKKEPMLWECAEKHKWQAPLDSVKHNDTWCPACSKGRSEKVARKIVEDTTGTTFNSIRPNWLRYLSGKNLELDGYNGREKIAFEYHGKQHYEEIDFFHRCEGDFERQLERDAWKEAKCKEKGVDLIIIPYTYDYNNEDEMRQFIEVEVSKIYTKRGKSSDIDGYSIYPDKIQCFECNQTIEGPDGKNTILTALDNYPNCCLNSSCVSYYKK